MMGTQPERKAKLKISARAAALVKGETPREEKLKAARSEISLAPSDLVSVLLYLSRDPDGELKEQSIRSLKGLDEDILCAVCSEQGTHQLILDTLARIHHTNPRIAVQIAVHPNTERRTLVFLAEQGLEAARILMDTEEDGPEDKNTGASPAFQTGVREKEDEEHGSKYQATRKLGVREKIKLALTGDREWRTLMIRDNNRVVAEAVLKNPRITEQEILVICKSSVNHDEILRIICANKEWTKNHNIRKALIENHRTPLHYALRFVTFLGDKELSLLAKSKNVSSVIITQARKMLVSRKSGR